MLTKSFTKRLTAAVISSALVLQILPVAASPIELSLDDSIALALKNNPTIKMAEADQAAAAGKIGEAKSAKGPTLDFSHADTEYSTDVSVKTTPKYTNSVSLSLPLYTGGKLEGLISQAQLGLKVADLGYEQSKQQVKLDATTAYYNVLQARNMLKLSEESRDRLKAHLVNVQAQFDVGTVAKVDVLRSEVELANAEQALIKARNAYDLALASLNNVIGLSLDTEIHVKDELKYTPFKQTLEECINFAMENRPEIGQVDANVDIAKQGIKVAKSGHLPTVAVSGSKSWYDNDFPGFENDSWKVSLVTKLNVFDSKLTDSKIKQADATLDKAQEKARQTKDSVQLDVRQAYLNVRESEKRIHTTEVAVSKAEEDFKIAQVRYSSGVGTNIDVLDAQVALTQAKTNYIQALYDYNTSLAKLNKAMGIAVQ